MNDDQKPRKMETFSLVGTEEELDRFKANFAKAGWKLKYVGHSGSWLGEPIYEIKTSPQHRCGHPDCAGYDPGFDK